MGHCSEVKTFFDNGLIIFGDSFEDLFETAALKLTSLLTDDEVRTRYTYHTEVCGENKQKLIVNFLNELLFIFHTEGIIFGKFKVRFFDVRGIGAECWAYGEPFNVRTRHRLKNWIEKIKPVEFEGKFKYNFAFNENCGDPNESIEVEIVFGDTEKFKSKRKSIVLKRCFQ